MREALEMYKDVKNDVRAILIGIRRGDPYAGERSSSALFVRKEARLRY